jgi:hypothetical protein
VVGPELGRHGEDSPLGVDGHRGVVDLVAGVVGGDEVFLAVFDPAHRTAQPPGGPGDEEVFWVVLAPHPEAAADRGLAHRDPRRRDPEVVGELGPVGMRDLGRPVHDQPFGEGVVLDDQPAGVHWHAGVPPGAEFGSDHRRGVGECVIDGAELRLEIGDQVAFGEEDSSVGRDRVEVHVERLDLDVDQVGGVLGEVLVGGDDDGDRLPDVADPVVSEHRLQVGHHPLVEGHPRPDDGDPAEVGDDVRRRPHGEHTGAGAGRSGVHTRQSTVGDGGADDAEVDHAGRVEVADEAGRAPHEWRVLVATDRPADAHDADSTAGLKTP